MSTEKKISRQVNVMTLEAHRFRNTLSFLEEEKNNLDMRMLCCIEKDLP